MAVVAVLAFVASGCVSDGDRQRMDEAVAVGAQFYERVQRGSYTDAAATLRGDETPEEIAAGLRSLDERLGPVQRARLAGRTWSWTNGRPSFELSYHVDRARVVADEVVSVAPTGPDGWLVVTGYDVDWDPDLVTP